MTPLGRCVVAELDRPAEAFAEYARPELAGYLQTSRD
jgi:hypothetical protein